MADNHVDLQERRQGDRAPERLLDHLHGEARPHVDRQLVPHPLEPLARRRERVRRRDATLQAVPRRPDRVRAELAIFLAPTSTRTSATRPAAGRRRRSPGGTTTGRAASASSGTARRCASRRGSPAPTRTRTSRSRRCSRPGSTGSRTSSSSAPAFEGNAYESDAERFPHSLARRSRALEEGAIARARPRRRGRRPLPELRAHRAAPLRPGRHRLRAGANVRAWLESARSAITVRTSSRGALGRLGSRRPRCPADYVRDGRARRRPRAARAAEPTTAIDETLDVSRRVPLLRRLRPRSGDVRRRAAPRDDTARARARRGELALLKAALDARPAGARRSAAAPRC